MHHLLPPPQLEKLTALPTIWDQNCLSIFETVFEVSSLTWDIESKPSPEKAYSHSWIFSRHVKDTEIYLHFKAALQTQHDSSEMNYLSSLRALHK